MIENLLILAANDSSAYQIGKVIGGLIGLAIFLGIPVLAVISTVMYVKSKRSGWMVAMILSIASVLVGLVLVPVLFIGAKAYKEGADRAMAELAAEERIIESDDGLLKIQMRDGWQQRSDLNENAQLQCGNPRLEEYLIVLNDSKLDIDLTMDEYTQAYVQELEGLMDNAEVGEIHQLKIAGRDAQQVEILGSIDKIQLVYQYTFFEDEQHFYKVLAWTLKSKKPTAFKNFNKALASIQLTSSADE
ncbi:hypothetical protein [Persicirhabdus sediminis]|uniref:Uncharacterized protein n=1 Tax=Persicirhabdus sediminis TaxID=454144 RepID=A0A8J7MHV2_9BACT|nr:hypothetical protein [Persicirhabdus sediminis]MBK1792244.1 hypothetical protein [Persicirhabdus sediminis]